MRISVDWLKKYADIENVTIKELSDRLTLAGLEVEGVETSLPVEGVTAVKILSKEKHPQADKLNICSVTDGKDVYRIVCGAPNAEAGQIAALAKTGAKLPGIIIKKALIRGVESLGMLCSEKELGVASDHSGILVLPPSTPLGADINEILGLGDAILELNVTPNRPDWLSVVGVARETGAVFGVGFREPSLELKEVEEETLFRISVEVLEPEKCPIYTARIIKGIKLGPSPLWMQSRLRAAGIRPINNAVDVTNYILMEYGQPLHAFDLRHVDKGIIVRNALPGESIVTLDGKERRLEEDVLVIADHSKPLGIAGIMGGEYTSILEDTREVLLECAYFSPETVRKTSKGLGLSSDSSYRYERGIDFGAVERLSDYAAAMMAQICGGEVLKGRAGGVFKTLMSPTVSSSAARINALLGSDISSEKMADILNRLHIETDLLGETLISRAPSFRVDISREADIAEEVARIYGYDKIKTTVPFIDTDPEPLKPLEKYTRLIRGRLETLGFSEVVNFSFMAPEYLSSFDKEENFVKILNPISADMAWMRSLVFPGLLKNLQTNRNQGNADIRLFEMGASFRSQGPDKLAEEKRKLALGVTGNFFPLSWIKVPEADAYYYLKGVLDNLFAVLGFKADYGRLDAESYMHPGKSAEIRVGDEKIGFLGALRPDFAESLDMKAPVYIAEIDFTEAVKIAEKSKITYSRFSRFPSAERDLSVIVESGVAAADIVKIVKNSAPLITEVRIFDVYCGKGIEEGRKSVAFRIVFSNLDKTLSDSEIDPIIENILENLKRSFGAKLR